MQRVAVGLQHGDIGNSHPQHACRACPHMLQHERAPRLDSNRCGKKRGEGALPAPDDGGVATGSQHAGEQASVPLKPKVRPPYNGPVRGAGATATARHGQGRGSCQLPHPPVKRG